ncbi:MAG: hypothetical protein II551_05230 [Paludibacteraceae bacterium]|nr:hypothetical protein [Paludibacteraceae bacterium]
MQRNKLFLLLAVAGLLLLASCKKTQGPASLQGRWIGGDDSTSVVASLFVDTVYGNGGFRGSLKLDTIHYPVWVNYNPLSCKGLLFYENDRDSLGKVILNDSSNLVGNIRGESEETFRLEVYRHRVDSTQTLLHLFQGSLHRAN